MAISDRLNKLTTDITNAYTSIENKGGTIPANKNTNNLPTAIDSIQSSNIIGATAEGESLSLTNTKAMPYSDYVVKGKSEQDGEPSPSIPSEIHSVADDVNLLPYPYKDTTNSPIISNGVTWNDNGDGTVIANGTPTGFTSFFINDINDPISILPNTTYTLSGGSTTDGVVLNFTEYDDNNNVITTHDNVTTKTFTTSSSTTRLIGMLKRYSNSISINNFTIKPKLQKGTVTTPYSPYNQGTVTIKQRGKTESNDYTIQTEPLRSLPNGVKDTIEADGIHRRVGVFNFAIADMNNLEDYPGWKNLPELVAQFPNQNELLKNVTSFMCNFVQNNDPSIRINTNATGILWLEKVFFGLTQSQWKEQYPDLVVKIQYQLSEEAIEPLTQQQATTMLDIIKTGSYEGTTNIHTDEDVKPTIGVDYYKKG